MPRFGYKAWLVSWHAITVVLVLGATGFGLDWTMERAVLDQFDAALLHLAQSEASEIEEEGDVPQGPTLTAASTIAQDGELPGSPTLVPESVQRLLSAFNPGVQLDDFEGHVTALVGAPRALAIPAALIERVRRGEILFHTVRDPDGRALRVVAVRAWSGSRSYMVMAAETLSEVHTLLTRIRLLLLGTFAGVLFAILLTDVLLARRALRPIDAIVERARRIRDTNLTDRLPRPAGFHELGRLVDTLNDMLTRLDGSFQTQHRFTADAAHELRSPLTRLRTEIEVTLRRPRDAAEYRAVLELSLDEIERLARLTEDLLALARLDAGEDRAMPMEPAPLTQIMDRVVDRFTPIATRRGVTLVRQPPRHSRSASCRAHRRRHRQYPRQRDQVLAPRRGSHVAGEPPGRRGRGDAA